MSKLVIRADASSEIGAGHAMRCLALAQAARKSEIEVIFIYAECTDDILQKYQSVGCSVKKTPSSSFGKKEADLISLEAELWVVVDSYAVEKNYIKTLQENGLKVLCLDDEGRDAVIGADIILNQNISAKVEWYAGASNMLLGAEYTLLRNEFLNPEKMEKENAVLVTTGGTDEHNLTPDIVEILLCLMPDDFRCHVVIGPANPYADELQRLFGDVEQVELLSNVKNMQPEFSRVSLVITGAGSTVWECLSLGVPMITMTLASNQAAIAVYLAEHRLAPTAGDIEDAGFAKQLWSEIESFFQSSEKFSDHAARGMQLIDGHGALRILKQMQL